MRRRTPDRALTRVLVVVLAAFAFAGAGTAAAGADPLPPPVLPPGVTPPPDSGGNDVPPGPTYLITPGTGGTELGEPVDQQQIDEAKKMLNRAPGKAKAPAGTKKNPGAKAGPGAPVLAPPTVQGDLVAARPVGIWWQAGSGALLLVVLLEFARSAKVGFKPRAG